MLPRVTKVIALHSAGGDHCHFDAHSRCVFAADAPSREIFFRASSVSDASTTWRFVNASFHSLPKEFSQGEKVRSHESNPQVPRIRDVKAAHDNNGIAVDPHASRAARHAPPCRVFTS
jgi:hypothetical protein